MRARFESHVPPRVELLGMRIDHPFPPSAVGMCNFTKNRCLFKACVLCVLVYMCLCVSVGAGVCMYVLYISRAYMCFYLPFSFFFVGMCACAFTYAYRVCVCICVLYVSMCTCMRTRTCANVFVFYFPHVFDGTELTLELRDGGRTGALLYSSSNATPTTSLKSVKFINSADASSDIMGSLESVTTSAATDASSDTMGPLKSVKFTAGEASARDTTGSCVLQPRQQFALFEFPSHLVLSQVHLLLLLLLFPKSIYLYIPQLPSHFILFLYIFEFPFRLVLSQVHLLLLLLIYMCAYLSCPLICMLHFIICPFIALCNSLCALFLLP